MSRYWFFMSMYLACIGVVVLGIVLLTGNIAAAAFAGGGCAVSATCAVIAQKEYK